MKSIINNKKYGILYLGICILSMLYSCNEKQTTSLTNNSIALLERSQHVQVAAEQSMKRRQTRRDSITKVLKQKEYLYGVSDTTLIDIEKISSRFVLDMKYATTANFLETAVYPCSKCYVRAIVAKALLKVNQELISLGYQLKFFDCYRPYSVQQKMWEIYPVPGYVADPKGGSVHNRGAAVDVTLVDLKHNDIDMGTPFDHFGKEAHHSYKKLPNEVLKHRKVLRTVMEKYGFKAIKKEWWHYKYQQKKYAFRIKDFVWECKE